MNSFERIRAVLTFQEMDHPPVVPEIFGVAATLVGESPYNYVRSGAVIARCQLEAQKIIGHDALFATADLCVEPEALGCGLNYPGDNYPYIEQTALNGHSWLDKLSVPIPSRDGRMPEVLNAVRILKREAGGAIPVVATAAGPMTLASRIMDIEKMLYMIVDQPARFRELIDFCSQVCMVWTLALAEEGADIISIVDPSSSPSVLPAKIYREFSEAPVRLVFSSLKRAHPEILTWYSVAGPLQNNPAIISRTGADITTVDYVVPIETAMEYSGTTVINGNLKPLMFLDADPDGIYRASRKLLSATRVRERFILGSGCEVPLYSKAENIRSHIKASVDEQDYFYKTNSRDEDCRDVKILPHRKKVYVKNGATLLDALNLSGVQITNYCTKNGSCGKCLIKVKKGYAHPPVMPETTHLNGRTGNINERLACHIIVREPMEIYIPYFSRMLPNSSAAPEEFISKSIDEELETYGFSVSIVAEPVGAFPADAPPAFSREDWLKERFEGVAVDPKLAKKLAHQETDRDGNDKGMFAVIDRVRKQVLDFCDTDKIYGLAIDIGTTTVSAYVHDLKDGKFICVGSIQNPQNRWGQDIVTRSANAARDPSLLPRMQRSLIEGINLLISGFHQSHSVQGNQIFDMVFVGNPVMAHLLLGLSPARLTQSPFVPEVEGWVSRCAEDFRFPAQFFVNPKCRVEVLPAIGGFVGADAVAGILAVSMHDSDEISLLVDIGTNGEVVLGNRSWMFATSVAAGPAFEGSTLTHGHLVRKGIIHSMKMNGDGQFNFKTIGGAVPLGLCGSSVIDVLSEFVRFSVINRRGKFLGEAENPNIKNGHYVVVPKQKTAIFKPITVSKKDIEEIQKAKSAIRTAIELLIKEARIRPDDVRNVYISGAFGISINLENAKQIGMIPDFPWAKYKFIKNSAGVGARLALLSTRARNHAVNIAAMSRHMGLADQPDFNARFIENMLFPAPQ